MTDALPQPLIEKGIITDTEFKQKLLEERAVYQRILNPRNTAQGLQKFFVLDTSNILITFGYHFGVIKRGLCWGSRGRQRSVGSHWWPPVGVWREKSWFFRPIKGRDFAQTFVTFARNGHAIIYRYAVMSYPVKLTLFLLAFNIIGFAEDYLLDELGLQWLIPIILVTAFGAVLPSRRWLTRANRSWLTDLRCLFMVGGTRSAPSDCSVNRTWEWPLTVATRQALCDFTRLNPSAGCEGSLRGQSLRNVISRAAFSLDEKN
jgi:hypothetical protein